MRNKFKSEFKKQFRFAIAAAVGFIIAFAWREFVIELAGKALQTIISLNPISSKLTIAIIITLFGVLLIVFSSKLIK